MIEDNITLKKKVLPLTYSESKIFNLHQNYYDDYIFLIFEISHINHKLIYHTTILIMVFI